MMILNVENTAKHVHTARCGHALGTDRELVETCIMAHVDSLTVTDHAPFPGDPFGGRMKYSELNEYIHSFEKLKKEYSREIEIHIGLEIEFFQSYINYYEQLKKINELDFGLLLGQHMYLDDELYSFALDSAYLNDHEYIGLGNAIIDGMTTGLFQNIAHPDRIFRKKGTWDNSCTALSKRIIDCSIKHGIPLEINLSSINSGLYREEFWECVRKDPRHVEVFIGLDAHNSLQIFTGVEQAQIIYDCWNPHNQTKQIA